MQPTLATPAALALRSHGAELVARLPADTLVALAAVLARQPSGRPGVRLCGVPGLAPHLRAEGEVGCIAAAALGAGARPVRAILFDKNPAANWSLGWHQDRTIAVRHRRAVPGFGPWTTKAGMQHVAPPVAVLQRMLMLRLHLDPVFADNAPLLVAPGSHRLGLVPERNVAEAVRRCGTVACLAEPGDVWAYATLVLHASEAAARPARRRVLQVDYSADELPGGLEWLGI